MGVEALGPGEQDPRADVGRGSSGAPPSSWIAPAVLVTLCCFSPTGIVAVYYAAAVRPYWVSGNRRLAVRNARLARRWVWVSVLLWAVVTLVLIATGRLGRLLEAGVL